MVVLDMSEYQQDHTVWQLIEAAGLRQYEVAARLPSR
jgi:hypothetical protein